MLLIPKVSVNHHMDSNKMVASTKCNKMAMVASSNISNKDKVEEAASTKTEAVVAVVAVEVNTKVAEVVVT